MTARLSAAELAAMEARFERMKRREQPPTTVNGPPVSKGISNAELLAMEARRAAADRRLALLKYRTQHA